MREDVVERWKREERIEEAGCGGKMEEGRKNRRG